MSDICPVTGKPHRITSYCTDAYGVGEYLVVCLDCRSNKIVPEDEGLQAAVSGVSRQIADMEIENIVGPRCDTVERYIDEAKRAASDAAALLDACYNAENQ